VKLRVGILEDEPLARDRLRNLLQSEVDVEVIGAWSNGKEAIQAMQSSLPDVIFLDVQMPEMDGFTFLQAIPPDSLPVVIIVTGQEKHAMKAFDFQAVDFLLKPFDRERFRLTLQRARDRIQDRGRLETDDIVTVLRRMLDAPRGATNRIAITNNGRIVLVAPDEIDWIGSADNYAEFHAGQSTHLLLSTLTALEARLPAARFVRISRCAIINVSRVKELRLDRQGRCTAVLQDGTELAVSSTYRRNLDQLLGR
jgi:two-component system LytT family response regulator